MLSIGEEDTALVKATESGDTDLVYLVLFHIWQKVLLSTKFDAAFIYLVTFILSCYYRVNQNLPHVSVDQNTA